MVVRFANRQRSNSPCLYNVWVSGQLWLLIVSTRFIDGGEERDMVETSSVFYYLLRIKTFLFLTKGRRIVAFPTEDARRRYDVRRIRSYYEASSLLIAYALYPSLYSYL